MYKHVCTWLYKHVCTCLYRFAESCPGGQDSRWRHHDTSDVGLWQMKLGVLNEYTSMVVHTQTWTNAAWLPRTSLYMSFNQYTPVCTWYVLGTYQYVLLRSPKSFWGYYVFTFDNGKRYCVYGTGIWWRLKTKTVPASGWDFMALALATQAWIIMHVIIPQLEPCATWYHIWYHKFLILS